MVPIYANTFRLEGLESLRRAAPLLDSNRLRPLVEGAASVTDFCASIYLTPQFQKRGPRGVELLELFGNLRCDEDCSTILQQLCSLAQFALAHKFPGLLRYFAACGWCRLACVGGTPISV